MSSEPIFFKSSWMTLMNSQVGNHCLATLLPPESICELLPKTRLMVSSAQQWPVTRKRLSPCRDHPIRGPKHQAFSSILTHDFSVK